MSNVSSTPVSLPAATVSPEVWEHARKERIEGPMRYLLEATPRVFPTATSINVYLEPRGKSDVLHRWVVALTGEPGG